MFRLIYFDRRSALGKAPAEGSALAKFLEKHRAARRLQQETWAEWSRRHPVYAFYSYLWQNDRHMLFKVVGTTYLLPIVTDILPHFYSPLKWISASLLSNKFATLNWRLYNNLQQSQEWNTEFAKEYAFSVIYLSFLRSIRQYLQNRVNVECQYVIERLVLERLLYAEIDYDFEEFTRGKVFGTLASEVFQLVNIFHAMPETIISIIRVGWQLSQNVREGITDLITFSIQPAIDVAMNRLVTFLRDPQRKRKSLVKEDKPKRQLIDESMSAMSEVQVYNLQPKLLRTVDALNAGNVSKVFSTAVFIEDAAFNAYDTMIVYQIMDVYVKHQVLKRRGWTWTEYTQREAQTAPFRNAVRVLINAFSAVPNFREAHERVMDLFDIPTWRDEEKRLGPVDLGKFNRLEVSNVQFTYSGAQKPALVLTSDDVITFGANKVYMIKGMNQSGKSTLVALLCKLYMPQQQNITWNGIPYERIPRVTLRNRISYVSQKPHIFAGTVKDNILIGNPKATDDEVRYAANCVGLSMFDSTADPEYLLFQKPIAKNGDNISGGFARAIAFARIFVRPFVDVIILDESMSNIDFIKRQEIIQHLMDFREKYKITLIVITHDTDSFKNVDWIYLLNNGALIGQGTHSELLKTNSYYQKMVLSPSTSAGSAPTIKEATALTET